MGVSKRLKALTLRPLDCAMRSVVRTSVLATPRRLVARRWSGVSESLDALASQLGLEGQVLTIPRLHARIPERQVPVVVAGLVGIATLFFGWRVLAVAAALHVLSGFSETAPAGPGAPPRGAAGGTAGRRPAQ